MNKRILITGGFGFVGSHFTEHFLKNTDWEVVILDRLSYAADIHRVTDAKYLKGYEDRLSVVYHDLKYSFPEAIIDKLGKFDYIVHLAANSHVDRSITNPKEFFEDNVLGTVNMLEFLRLHNPEARFINFGTDEVFGAAPDNYNYKERDRWNPSNPYSASKCGQLAAGISYHTTYGLDIITTYTMNIFGERQHPEKLVPLAMKKIINGEQMIIHSKLKAGCTLFKLPSGNYVTEDPTDVIEVGERHWLHARNAADAILYILKNGIKGEHYNVVGDTELSNDEFVLMIGKVLGKPVKLVYEDFHSCRPGHDRRYALDGTKLAELGWKPPYSFEESLKKTVEWTLENDK